MSFDDLVKQKNQRKGDEKKREEEEAVEDQNMQKETAISHLKRTLSDLLPNLIPELEPVVYNYDPTGGAFADFALKGKKFLFHAEMRSGTKGGFGSFLVLAIREEGNIRQLGNHRILDNRRIFVETYQKFEDYFIELLQKEVGT